MKTLLRLFVLLLLPLPLFAQGDTVTRNPECVQLRRIWKLEGRTPRELVGAGVGSAGDVNRDGLADFAVFSDLPNRWMIFYGSRDSISSTPAATIDSCNYVLAPVVGDFWGTGHKAVGFHRTWLDRTTLRQYDWLRIFRTDSNRLEDTPSAVWYAVSPKDTSLRASVSGMIAADLDGDGDDELIAALRWVTIEGRYGQLWIYEGGPGFQVETPTVIIKDPLVNDDFFRVHAGDIDGDGTVDLMTIKSQYAAGIGGQFYWGPIRNGQLPDRTVLISPQTADYSQFISLADCDGDGVQDLVKPGTLIWRSGSGKSAHTRAWTLDDADISLKSAGGMFSPVGQPGYLNSKRYEMIASQWSSGAILFSGGPNGPNNVYDATYYPAWDTLKGFVPLTARLGDVNGDGWDDAIGATQFYPSDFVNAGAAVIVAGGPYIPNDDPSLGVRNLELESRSDALSLWPNPVREELNIAWRGDLKRLPQRFEIHDMLGQFVSSGSVPEGEGSAVWRCASQPAGAYLLSVFDATGFLLATTRFIKH